MKTALMTGANSGIGKAIREELVKDDYKVFNIGRDGADITCDLQNSRLLEKRVKEFLKTTDVNLLVNCAGVGIFQPHEELSLKKIDELIDVNLKAPVLLCNLCLRSLKKTKGCIINISSIEATQHSKFSALYTATKSGLRDFSLTLFEELRKSEVRVTNINPDITKTAFFDDLQFEPIDDKQSYIDPKDLAKSVIGTINSPFVTTDITLRAQKFAIKKK